VAAAVIATVDRARMGTRIARLAERALFGATLLLLVLGALAWHRALRPVRVARPAWGSVPALAVLPDTDSVTTLVTRIADADLFRLARHPSAIAYRPGVDPNAPAPPPPPAPPKPPLAVAGIVGGPPWAALLDGVPGHDGSVLVHPGDTLAQLTVRAVRPGQVVITGIDTTWRRALKSTWH
jgi:hypothetical protein